MTRLRRLLAAASVPATALAVAGCEVRTSVDVTVADDGSGTVEVAVGLDDEALAEVPDLDGSGVSDRADLAALVRTDDLADAGWTPAGPEAGDGGMTWVRVTKPFGTPEEGTAVLDEVTGPDGPLGDMGLSRSAGFASSEVRLTGTVDLAGGIEAFGDEGLAGALDGEPIGEDAAAMEQRLGRPLGEVFTVELVADLPGSVDANTDERVGAAPVWRPVLGGEAVAVEATATERNLPALLLAGLAVAAAVALVALLGVRFARRR